MKTETREALYVPSFIFISLYANFQSSVEYIQFISIEYIVLIHISLFISYKETIENIREISICHKTTYKEIINVRSKHELDSLL